MRALLALGHFKLHALVFGERLEAFALDFLEVGEEILAAIVGGDESKALAFVEPFDGSGFGGNVLLSLLMLTTVSRR